MKKSSIIWIAAALMSVACVQGALATESRSQSLLYNLAFEDQTDVFMFPHLLPDYQGAYFHLPEEVENVFGGVILNLDDNQAVGAFVHRPLLTAFDQYRITVTDAGAALFDMFAGGAGNALEPHLAGQVFDLMYGARSWGAGMRFHLWSDASTQQGQLDDPPEVNSAVTGELYGGFRLSPGFDLRVSLAVRDVKDTETLVVARVGTRYMTPGNQKLRWVAAGEIEFGVYSPDGGDSSLAVLLPVKAGARLSVIPDTLFLGLLGGIDLQVVSVADEDMRLGLAVPSLEMAAEWYALSWLQLRTAIKGGYGIQFAGATGDNTPKYEQMAFSTGLGFLLGSFSIDAIMQYDLWQSGPWFVGGNSGLFAGVSLAYRWGKGVKAKRASLDSLMAVDRAQVPDEPKANAKAANPSSTKKKQENQAETDDSASFEGWEEQVPG